MKWTCKYRDGEKKREITLKATSRSMAIIGLAAYKRIYCKDIISLNKKKKS